MFTNDELHKRIKLLEEEVCYLSKCLDSLITEFENIEYENHYHLTYYISTKPSTDESVEE